MIRKKIAVVGAYAVGKTSLVQRFVNGIFSDRYLTTVGVKIDKCEVEVDGETVMLVVWDLEGEDGAHQIRHSHVRGAAGLLLVADGTRAQTLEIALRLGRELEEVLGPLPSLLLVNKADLRADWEVTEAALVSARSSGRRVLETSALSGSQVQAAFEELARDMLRDA
ncbi:MAG: GTP-binding protein [bacterium]|nr:GTP-binding protein [bacterium]